MRNNIIKYLSWGIFFPAALLWSSSLFAGKDILAFNLNGNFGFSSSLGRLDTRDTDGTAERAVFSTPGYSAGLKAWYSKGNDIAFSLGVLYSSKPTTIEFPQENGSITHNFTFVDIPLGIKLQLHWFYFDIGLFYGFRVGYWDTIVAGSTIDESKYRDRQLNNEWGFYTGLGGIYYFTENIGLELGIKIDYSFATVCRYKTYLFDPILISINTGIIFQFEL
ncbi:MAG: PorT family protein [bacterium]|nr:PorT family protein [bacterium]